MYTREIGLEIMKLQTLFLHFVWIIMRINFILLNFCWGRLLGSYGVTCLLLHAAEVLSCKQIIYYSRLHEHSLLVVWFWKMNKYEEKWRKMNEEKWRKWRKMNFYWFWIKCRDNSEPILTFSEKLSKIWQFTHFSLSEIILKLSKSVPVSL